MAKKGLGNGLSALFSEKPVLEEKLVGERVLLLPLAEIEANPNQPRQFFDAEKLKELISSVKEQGVLQPILVRPKAEKGYEIIAGERRYRAATAAGLNEIPCIVRNLDDHVTLEVALIENIQRQNLNPMEEALTYRALMDQYNYTQVQLAEKLGKSRVYIANMVRLLSLPKLIQEAIIAGQLSAGHGKALLQLPKEKDRIALAEKIIMEQLSVRQAENFAKNPQGIYEGTDPQKKAKTKTVKRKKPLSVDDLVLQEMGEKLRAKLGTKVSVQKTNEKQGKIVM